MSDSIMELHRIVMVRSERNKADTNLSILIYRSYKKPEIFVVVETEDHKDPIKRTRGSFHEAQLLAQLLARTAAGKGFREAQAVPRAAAPDPRKLVESWKEDWSW